MPEIDTAVQEALSEMAERIDDAVRRINVAALGGHNPNPHPAPSQSGDATTVLALDEQTKEIRKLRQDLATLPDRIATSLENAFTLEEELDDEPTRASKKGSTKSGNAGAATKRGNADDGEEEPVRRRPGYFGAKD
jgi:hypothetical protein